jgi:hypothetical protein
LDREKMAKVMYDDARKWQGHEEWNDLATNDVRNKKEWLRVADALIKYLTE